MRTKDLIDLADDPNLIPGIYNYCDRWCERCAFSARCLVYLTEKEDDDGDPASRDITNASFWKRLAGVFQQTREMITALAQESGVDRSPEALASVAEQKKTERREATDHTLSKAAQDYASDVSDWFKKTSAEPQAISDTRGDAEEAEQDANDELDAAEVIRWYQFFIAAKITRGLMSRIHEAEDEEEDECSTDTYARDSDGSVKVALIAVDRSISAWKLMADVRGENAEPIHNFLLQLEKLRLSTEREFPKAREFMRPGFDEAGLDRIN